MPRFNATAKGATRTTNRAGGAAYTESAKLQLASHILTSMVSDQYYRSAGQGISDLKALLPQVDPLFAAKAAVYARREHGLRSISHVIAGELAHDVKGTNWMRPFMRSVVVRVDDITEIMSYYISQYGRRPIPNVFKGRRGLREALRKFDEYQVARYRADDKKFSLVDFVNLTHPYPSKRNGDAVGKLVAGTLRNENTWESGLSAAGNVVVEEGESREDAVAEAKSEAWGDLISSKRLGYTALLRNLRNIANQAPESLDAALEMLTDENMIRRSRVLPFQFTTAASEISALPHSRKILDAIEKATEISMANVPTFEGKTLIVVDGSGSMQGFGRFSSGKTPADIASLFAAVLYKANPNADLMTFSMTAQYLNLPPAGVLSIANSLKEKMDGGGTNFHAIFEKAQGAYDRVIILSDMQGWVGHDTPAKEFAAYKKRTGANPHVYSFDLQGYGTLQFPEAQVFALAGFSDKVFNVMATLEQDRNALVTAIEAVTFEAMPTGEREKVAEKESSE